MIDNHDSFTYNLVHYMEDSAWNIEVIVTKPEALYSGMMEELDISGIVISPGPSHPADRPEVIDFIKDAWGTVPILGICLGHQMIWHMAGGTVGRGARPVHGHISAAIHDGGWMFGDIPSPFNVTRYHSLVTEGQAPPGFEVSAWTGDGVVMAIRHKEYDIAGLQYHPEAILSEHGKKQLESFIRTVMEGGHHVRTHEIQKG